MNENIKIINKNIDDIIPYENNPRKNDDAVDVLANSIKEFGFKVPIIIDKENVVVAGHTRLKALQKLGYKNVPCIVADDLTDEQIKAFRLADNKVAEKSEWDFNKLDLELDEIDFDMTEFGFDTGMKDDNYGTEFELKDGDREPIQTMNFTFSDEQAERINEAISKMKQTQQFKDYEDEINKNSNGNALYLVVLEWLLQKT